MEGYNITQSCYHTLAWIWLVSRWWGWYKIILIFLDGLVKIQTIIWDLLDHSSWNSCTPCWRYNCNLQNIEWTYWIETSIQHFYTWVLTADVIIFFFLNYYYYYYLFIFLYFILKCCRIPFYLEWQWKMEQNEYKEG